MRAELEALRGRPVDTSDIPELDEGFWERAVPNPFYKPNKTQLTVRLDSDVLTWLKAGGKGYQSKLNAILRQAMLRDAPKR
ncbi:MAG: hypothetical protein K0R83_1637 [Caulobacter sp.]|jgi:uncharacterized protein (DUF4415 family)|nr:hypothetical protein [Caulobacter sp.]